MAIRSSQGQYRTKPLGDRTPMAYVMAHPPIYITEAAYRAKGYRPVFEKLPTEDEYHSQRP